MHFHVGQVLQTYGIAFNPFQRGEITGFATQPLYRVQRDRVRQCITASASRLGYSASVRFVCNTRSGRLRVVVSYTPLVTRMPRPFFLRFSFSR